MQNDQYYNQDNRYTQKNNDSTQNQNGYINNQIKFISQSQIEDNYNYNFMQEIKQQPQDINFMNQQLQYQWPQHSQQYGQQYNQIGFNYNDFTQQSNNITQQQQQQSIPSQIKFKFEEIQQNQQQQTTQVQHQQQQQQLQGMPYQDFSQQQSQNIFEQNTQMKSNKYPQQINKFDSTEVSQNNQQFVNPQQILQNPSMPIQITTHLTKEKQDEQHQLSYHQLIDYFFQRADIEIKITNIDRDVFDYFKEIQYNLKNLNLNIQNTQIDQSLKFLKSRIYQVNEQQDNNVSQLDKMTILHRQVIERFYSEAAKQQITIMIHSDKFQYKIQPQPQMEESGTKFYKYFKQILDSYIILIAYLNSEFEANSKFKLLKKPRIRESFCKEIDLSQLNIILASEINLTVLDEYLQLKNHGMALKKQANQIIVIGNSYDQNMNIKELQKKFEDFLHNPQYMKNVKETFDIDFLMPKDIDEIDKSLRKLKEQEELFEIIVTNPVTNVQNKGKYLVQAELQLWIEGDQPEYIIMQRLQTVKGKLNEIYHPNIIIKITEQAKIKLWNQFLGQLFENQNNSKECITKQNNLELSIELNGKQDAIFEKQQKIQQYLEQFKCIILNCQCDIDVAIVLQSKEYQFSSLFQEILAEIASEFGQCLIQMIEVNNKKQLVVEVYYNQVLFQQNIISQKINTFFENLGNYLVKIDFKEFLNYVDMKEIQFQNIFQVVVSKLNKESTTSIIGKEESLEEIRNLLLQFEQSKHQNQTSVTIDCENKLIFNKIKQLYSQPQQQNINQDNVIVSFPQENKIVIQASEKLIKQEKDNIIMKIQEQKSQIKNKICDFSDKEIKFINKNFKTLMEQLQKNNEVLFTMSSQVQAQPLQKKSVACTLEYKNKSIHIIYADISIIQCDAIVNSCNNKMSFGDHLQLSGVAQSIFEMGGTHYQSFCSEYIRKYKELKLGVVATYKMPIQRQIKYILNVATPIYSQGYETDEDLKKIEDNIKALFKEIKNLDIETLTVPIFGGGACGYSFNQAAKVVLNTTINQLYSENNSIKSIYIAELTDIKIDQLTKILKKILEPSIREREIKYQWQWQDSNDFKDYDDEEINKQIDEAYEQFELRGQEQNVLLNFPYSKQPGTHLINFKNKTVTDISLKTTKMLTSKIISNTKRYFFDQEQIDDQLNEYLMIQEVSDINKFTIFNKKHFLIFKEGQMYQMNQETQYKRKIQKIPYLNKRKPQKQQNNYLVDKKYNFQVTQSQIFKLIQQKNNNGQLTIQSFNVNLNEAIFKQIKQELKKEISKLEFIIPNLSEAEIENIQNYIEQTALSIEGRFLQGNKVIIEYFKKKHNKIVHNIDSLKNNVKQYPKEWINQNQNYLKVALQPGSDEYKKVFNLFKKTENGNIYEIFRIQNKSLWDNYVTEKNKLIQLYQQQEIILNPIETERYLWHGVREQHPQVIYSGLKEAFDYTYSDVGFWGTGIYFAENASYSRHYSYKLQQTDNQGNNKLVFLCCLITTGRVQIRQQDQSIKRAPPGYDCVSGLSNDGSNIFVLYSMDVRRAYPAYEIVFS